MPETLTIEIKEGSAPSGPPPVPAYSPPAVPKVPGGGGGMGAPPVPKYTPPPVPKPSPVMTLPGASGGKGAASAFDAADEARKQVEADRRRMLVRAEYEKLVPPKPPDPKPMFNAMEEARKAVERDRQKALVDAEYRKLMPPKPEPAFSAADEARKQAEQDRRRMIVEAQRKNLTDGPAQVIDMAGKARGESIGGMGKMLSQLNLGGVGNILQNIGAARAAGAQGMVVPAGASPLAIAHQVGQLAGGAVREAGSVAAKLAKDSASGMADALESTARKVPVIGDVAAEASQSIRKLMGAADAAAAKYANFSGETAGAQAMANVNEIMGNIRRAQELGPELSKYIDAKSHLTQTSEDVSAKFTKAITPALTRLADTAADLLELLSPFIEFAGDVLGGLLDAVNALLAWVGILAKEKKKDEAEDRRKALSNMLGDLNEFVRNAPPAPAPAPPPAIQIPAFQM